MAILALYVPKPEELRMALAQLAVAYFVLCAMAFRTKLSVPLAAVLMVLGGGIAIAPDLYAASQAGLGPYGNVAQEWSGTNHSDFYISLTGYMHVGRGKLLAFAGMSVALVLYASIVTYWRPRRSPPQGFDVISRDAPFDGISERHPS